MSAKSLKGVRTRYRGIIDKDLTRANTILQENIYECHDLRGLMKNTKYHQTRLKEFCQKLESTSSALMMKCEEEGKEEEVDTMTMQDCDLISEVSKLVFELSEFTSDIQLVMDERMSKTMKQSVDINDVVEIQTEMQKQIKDLLISQQESYKYQRETFEAKKREDKSLLSVKLPKLELKHYDGDKLKWLEFWDSFESTVHGNKRLSNVEKFSYLSSVLRGEAKRVVAGLTLTHDNYDVAIQLLRERYGEEQNVIDAFYTELMDMQPATNKTESLRALYNKFETNLRSLEALGQDTNQAVFVSMLTSKLPKHVLTQLELQKGAHNKWSVRKLRELLHGWINASERAEQSSGDKGSNVKPKEFGARENKPQIGQRARTSTEALFTAQSYSPGTHAKSYTVQSDLHGMRAKSYKDMCRYCEGKHWSDECRKFATAEDRKQKIKGSCYLCLKYGHKASDCKTNKTCVHCKKAGHHHRSLCPTKFVKKGAEMAHTVGESREFEENNSGTENVLVSAGEMVLMQTAKTEIRNSDIDIHETTRVILDSGSQRTYITESMAKRLNLKLGQCNEIKLVTFGEEKVKTIRTPTAKVDIKLSDGTYMTITVNIVPKISGDIVRSPVNVTSDHNWKYLFKSFELADDLPKETETSTIEVLIGNDYYLDVILSQRVEVHPGLYLLGSRFGWILTGRTSEKVDTTCTQHSLLILNYHQDIRRETSLLSEIDKSIQIKPNIKDFWNLENIGITDPVKDKGDDEALEAFNNTVEYKNKRYYVSWPWRNEHMSLPMNYELANGRLKTLLNKLRKNPDLMEKYDSIIQDQISRDMIERVPCDVTAKRLHYIPHHAVITPTKTTTKLRVVYDASAKTNAANNSLNDCLYRGPVMLQDLSGLLLRFRMNKIALTADIEKAFLQVGLLPADRDVTRFLWVKDINKQPFKDNLQEYRFKRVPFGIVSSPFMLAATIKYHVDQNRNQSTERLESDLYVDNLITGSSCVSEACNIYKETKHILQDASMNLREWMSNNQDVMKNIPSCDQAKSSTMKVLGMLWNADEDNISLQSNTMNIAKNDTKREILAQIASTFDPLGLFNPVVLRGKLFLQELWNKGIDWDEKLDFEQTVRWKEIEQDLSRLHEIHLPRYIGLDGNVEYKLLCFCDASKEAYSTAIYLHQTQGNERKTDIVYAKSRVAPKKELSIPRLELLGVLIGTRCVKFVKDQLRIPIVGVQLFTDSQCVLQWIDSDKPLSTFVHNRVMEIRQHDDISFHHVISKDNAADIASRGTNVSTLMSYEQWWHGPRWLKELPSKWPVSKELQEQQSENYQSEIKKSKSSRSDPVNGLVECEMVTLNSLNDPQCVIQIERFSSVTKLLRVTALVLKFLRKLKRNNDSDSNTRNVTSAEIQHAENLWVTHIQHKHYSEILNAIKYEKRNNMKQQLGLYLDDHGIIRCHGRIDNADLCEAAKHPILLPKGDKFTKLIIEKSHKQMMHAGVAQTLHCVREKFWVPHGRSNVKSVLKDCGICRRHEGGPFKMPCMPQLPRQRVAQSMPFTYTGLDYLGPLYVKLDSGTKKVWICLFTCMITRAIHLELLQDMSAEQFLLGLRRFIARRGMPLEILSDNAAQFKLSSCIIDQSWGGIIDSDDVKSYVANSAIKWNFIVERAPWMGGAYERLVGLVKRCLRKAVGKNCLTNEQMLTFVSESEAVVNSRPMVYINDDINSSVTLTPAHFLTLNPKLGIPVCENSDDQDYDPHESSARVLLRTWKKGLKLLDRFWQLWHKDYLLSLRERYQNKLKARRVQSCYIPNIGDIVLIHDELPRGTWRMGKISELNASSDGQIRSAKVTVSNGNTIGRPLNLLYPIECPSATSSSIPVTVDTIKGNNLDANNDNSDGESISQRPLRKTALESREKLKQLITSDSV